MEADLETEATVRGVRHVGDSEQEDEKENGGGRRLWEGRSRVAGESGTPSALSKEEGREPPASSPLHLPVPSEEGLGSRPHPPPPSTPPEGWTPSHPKPGRR